MASIIEDKTNAQIMEDGQKYVMNTYGRLPIAMVKGQGCHVWDADGKKYLDFVAGVAVNSVGHCNPKVVDAICTQANKLLHCSNLYWIAPQVELAKILVENSDLDKVFFCNSGAEANEGAIKLARKASKENHPGEQKYEIITMLKSFHGRTLATLTATGQDKVKTGFDPLPVGFKYVPYNDIEALKAAVSDITCAVMLEPVQGEGGVIAADDEYLRQVREFCDEKGLLLIFDEVQVGLGRTGKLFAYQNSGVVPDIMTLAKALGGGAPIGAVMAKD
ncbi:MAG: aminotransferase class III-fold pyridoxal phosphate-dependent enzyme, partial [Bacillota bacterium]